MKIRTGVDFIEINRLSMVDPAIRLRFLRRVFTELELDESKNQDVHLMGKFAAKEAVSKALGTGIGGVAWQEIEIISIQSGEPEVVLHGNARNAADRLNLISFSLSISHSNSHALAFVVAYGAEEH